ncbi:MAG: BBE domain-containing protein [Acidobacteriota bacterium]
MDGSPRHGPLDRVGPRNYAEVRPFLGTTRYLNYLDHDESGDAAAQTYGPNVTRLRELKAKYDPKNFFHLNLNIKPMSPQP